MSDTSHRQHHRTDLEATENHYFHPHIQRGHTDAASQRASPSAAPAAAAAAAAPPHEPATVDPHAVDSLLSQELQRLSFHDRSAIQEEIHGVATACPDETPELLSTSLQGMQHELDMIPSKSAYDEAQRQSLESQSFVNGDDVRLVFLRCEVFDAHKAAARFVTYLEVVLETFGPVALTRFIRFDDLGRPAQDLIQAGVVQVLPYRDRSGRRIVFCTDLTLENSFESMKRAAIYIFTVAAEDVESQRKGIAVVMWPANGMKWSPLDRREMLESVRLFAAYPARISSFHFCFRLEGPPTPLLRLGRAAFLLIVGESTRRRQQIHTGPGTEILYKLMGYGIPSDVLPLTETGDVKAKESADWTKLRRFKESIDGLRWDRCQHRSHLPGPVTGPAVPAVVECPLSNDVVFRNGRSTMCHPGNVMFRGLLETYYEQHRTAGTKEEKTHITWRIVDEVLVERKGRFLVWEGRNRHSHGADGAVVSRIDDTGVKGWWTHLDDRNAIRAKVAISLRDERKRVLAIRNQQRTASSTVRFLPGPMHPGCLGPAGSRRDAGSKRKRGEASDHLPAGSEEAAGGGEEEGGEPVGMLCSLGGIFAPARRDAVKESWQQ